MLLKNNDNSLDSTNAKNDKLEFIVSLLIGIVALSISAVAILYLISYLLCYDQFAILIYFFICLLQPIILPIPEVVTFMGGSSAFGPFPAAIIGFLGTILGIIVMYLLASVTGQKVRANISCRKHNTLLISIGIILIMIILLPLLSKSVVCSIAAILNLFLLVKFIDKHLATDLLKNVKLEQFNRYISKNEMLILFILFLFPVLPDEVICIGAGMAAINIYKFIFVALVSKLITSISLAYSFQLIKYDSKFIGIIASIIIVALLLKRFILNKHTS